LITRLLSSAAALTLSLVLTACGKQALQDFEYYLLNPGRLEQALAYCAKSDDASDQTYCADIQAIKQRYDALDSDYQLQKSYRNDYGGLYPEIDKKNLLLLEESEHLLALKQKGLDQG